MRTPYRAAVQDATRRFSERLLEITQVDPEDLARGLRGQTRSLQVQLSAEQQSQLLDAAQQLLLDLPAGALAPPLASRAQQVFCRNGVDVEDAAAKPLKELGAPAAQLAKQAASELANQSDLYGYLVILAAGATTAGLGYAQGSEVLEKLGLAPEYAVALSDNHRGTLAAAWGSKLENPEISARISRQLDSGVGYHVGTVGKGPNFAAMRPRGSVGVSLRRAGQQFAVNAQFADTLLAASGSASMRLPGQDTMQAFAGASLREGGKEREASLGLRGKTDRGQWETRLNATGSTVGLEASYSGRDGGAAHVEKRVGFEVKQNEHGELSAEIDVRLTF